MIFFIKASDLKNQRAMHKIADHKRGSKDVGINQLCSDSSVFLWLECCPTSSLQKKYCFFFLLLPIFFLILLCGIRMPGVNLVNNHEKVRGDIID